MIAIIDYKAGNLKSVERALRKLGYPCRITQRRKEIFIPFCVGGGIRTLEDMRQVLLAGAEKVSLNTAAVEDPKTIGVFRLIRNL